MRSVTVHYNGKDYQLLPLFAAAADIQARTGKVFAQAVNMAHALSITDLHAIFCAGMRANGHTIDEVAAGDYLIADYATHDTPFISQVLAYANAFFPQVQNEGTKKQTATTEQIG